MWQQRWQVGNRFTHPFYKYLLNAYYVPDTVTGTGEKMVRGKKGIVLANTTFTAWWRGRYYLNNYKNK